MVKFQMSKKGLSRFDKWSLIGILIVFVLFSISSLFNLPFVMGIGFLILAILFFSYAINAFKTRKIIIGSAFYSLHFEGPVVYFIASFVLILALALLFAAVYILLFGL
jgi:hypothetical protein